MKELIQTKKQLDGVLKRLDESSLFSLDTETNGKFGLYEVTMVGLSFGLEDYACYIPVAHLRGRQLPIEYVLEKVEPFLTDPVKEKVYHYAVFDEIVVHQHGIDIQGPCHDTIVMQHLFDENFPTKKLKALIEYHFGYKMQTYEEVIEAAPRKRGQKIDYNFAVVRLEEALSYAADDAYWTYKLFFFLKDHLEQQKIWNAYEHIEAPLQRVVRKMKERGVTIDLEAVRKADEVFPRLMEQLDAEIFKEAGEVFNIGSGKQLGPILFEKLGIGTKIPKTKNGQYSTEAKVLKMYERYPIVENVLRRKKIKKTHSTFVLGIDKYVLRDGKVHADFNTTGTDTGRFSSSKPNLQNQQGDEIEDIKIRDFFIPSPGCKLIVADYSQIELRLIAHFSKDKNMTEAFLSELRDFHDETARKMLEMQGHPISDDEEVTPRQRFHAKSLNFGIPYGRGDNSVAEMLGVHRRCAHWPTWDMKAREWKHIDPDTREEVSTIPDMCHNCGKCFITDWFSAFPDVERFRERVLGFTRDSGYIRTLSGRKRRIPNINHKDFFKRAHAERQTFNTKIQGSAGDILKIAMVALGPKLEDFNGYLLMTVHDELVSEVPEDTAEEAVVVIKETMENPFNGEYPLRLPMVVNPTICDRWSEGK